MRETTRLDAAESIFFARQLESIDDRVYEIVFPLLKGRTLVPAVTNVGEWDREYTYRIFERTGKAVIVGDKATDLPRVNVTGTETTARIKDVASEFSYSIPEIRAAMAKGVPLDDLDARAARRAIEEKMDDLIAFGAAADPLAVGMTGFANFSSIDRTTFVASTKDTGGDTAWSTVGADPLLIVRDINAIVAQVWSGLKQAEGLPDRITLVVPAAQYALIASTPVSTLATKSILSYCLENNPLLEAVVPWHKLTGAGYSNKDRMVAFVRDPMVLGSLVPLDFMRQPEQQRQLNFDIPCLARCGGTVWRYPVAAAYGDGI